MNRIKELRARMGWRQDELAKKLSKSRQAVGNYETGTRGLDEETIHQCCEIFGVTADYLLCLSSVPSLDVSEEEYELLAEYRELSAEGREYVRHSLALARLAHGEKNRAVPDVETAE